MKTCPDAKARASQNVPGYGASKVACGEGNSYICTRAQRIELHLKCVYCTVLLLSFLFELKWRRPSKTNPLILQKPQNPQKPPNVSNGVKQVAVNQMDLVNHIMTKNAGH